MKTETEKWARLAEEDLQAAKFVLKDSLFRPSIFHCQQSLEKLLKAIWIEQKEEGYPPREHNLNVLAQLVGLKLTKEQIEFFDDRSKQYTPSRYGDVLVDYSLEEAENYYQTTLEQFEWLRQHLR